MATTTPNFGWAVPTSTDLVKDGAVAIETLGDSIDASLVDLKGGTTGQVLSKASNTDMDFTWVAQDDSNAIQNAIVDAKGDIIAATANDTPSRLAVGANNTVLTADSTTATGLKWATPATGALTLISRTAVSAASSQTFDSVFNSTYENYLVLIQQCYGSVAAARLQFQYRYAGPTTQSTGYYSGFVYGPVAGGTPVTDGPNSNGSFAGLTRWNTSTNTGSLALTIQGVGLSATDTPQALGAYADGYNGWVASGGFINFTARNYTGFILTPSSGTFTANVSIYGYGKS